MTIAAILILGGIVVLAIAGDRLVEYAVALAGKLRLTPAVIGLTVVAMGTSIPEVFVSIAAALRGSPEMAVGNVVGSNIANIGLILGTCALLIPLPVGQRLLKFEYPFAVLASWLALLLCRDGWLDRLESAFFVASVVSFVAYSVWLARREVNAAEADHIVEGLPAGAHRLERRPLSALLVGLVFALVALGVGANLLVLGASTMARLMGVSERVIGLTIVAVGTSLPELVASLAAAAKRHVEMAAANVVGSNIFNLLLILGLAGIVKPIPIAPKIVAVDMWVMMVSILALFPLVAKDMSITRRNGALLLTGYVGYLAWLLLAH
jgi:cation:H+ antiporter